MQVDAAFSEIFHLDKLCLDLRYEKTEALLILVRKKIYCNYSLVSWCRNKTNKNAIVSYTDLQN